MKHPRHELEFSDMKPKSTIIISATQKYGLINSTLINPNIILIKLIAALPTNPIIARKKISATIPIIKHISIPPT